jgi:hypothetical protein
MQCHQNSHDILHRNRKKNCKIYMEAYKAPVAKAILSKMSNAGGIAILQNILLSHSNENSKVLKQKPTCTPVV